MGDLSVSMVTKILSVCVGKPVRCEHKSVDAVCLCEFLAGSHPETDCRLGISPATIAATFTWSCLKLYLYTDIWGYWDYR